MENPKKHRSRLLPILLLAVLCVGGTELAAISIFDPPLYHQITEPVFQAGRALRSGVRRLGSAAGDFGYHAAQELSDFAAGRARELSDWWEEVTAPPPEIPDSQDAGDPVSLSEDLTQDPAVTQLEIRDGLEVLTGGIVPVPYFNQGQEPWASRTYGSDPFARYGCGPAVMAMAVSAMTEESVDPDQMGQWAVKNGHWAKGGGSYLSLIQGAAEAYGLTAEALSEHSADAVQEALLSGRMLVALMGPGHFTKGGHFILLRGFTLSGDVLVADPNSVERSLAVWDPQLILDELSHSTADGAPLWILSPPDTY